MRVQTVWKTGEISWVQMDALKEQNPFALFNCVEANQLHNHPDFKWSKPMKDKQLAVNINSLKVFEAMYILERGSNSRSQDS